MAHSPPEGLFTLQTEARRMSIGMQCKARRVLRSLATRARCNAAMRPIHILPEGLARFPASALALGLQVATATCCPSLRASIRDSGQRASVCSVNRP
jgi:hypothetical protein